MVVVRPFGTYGVNVCLLEDCDIGVCDCSPQCVRIIKMNSGVIRYLA
jgi:hypothetical protein